MDNLIALANLREGDQGIIHSIGGGSSLTSRLAGMGLVTGARFRVAQVSGGMVVILVSSTRIALGRGESAKIMVYKIDPSKVCTVPVERNIRGAGQPNVGKSTVFNILTGLSQHVGNWPGKNVEKKKESTASGTKLIGWWTCRVL